MSTPQRPCNFCQAPSYPTGNVRIFGGYQEYQCERGHTFWSWAVPPRVRRTKS